MSISVPDDTASVLETLIKCGESVLNDIPLHRKLLLRGAIIDAKDLIAEIRGTERIDTHAEAIKVIVEEGKNLNAV